MSFFVNYCFLILKNQVHLYLCRKLGKIKDNPWMRAHMYVWKWMYLFFYFFISKKQWMWILLDKVCLKNKQLRFCLKTDNELQGSARTRPTYASLAFLCSTTGFICHKYLAYARPIDFKFIQFISMIHFHGRWIFKKLKIVKLYLQTSVQLALLVFVFSCSHLSMRKLGCNFLVLYLLVLRSQSTLSLV